MTELKRNAVKTVEARIRPATPGDEIVISGISGKFPSAENVAEFAKKLYNKVRSAKVKQKINFFSTRKRLKFFKKSSKCEESFSFERMMMSIHGGFGLFKFHFETSNSKK